MEEMGSEEKARVAKQREDLGEEGLKKKEEELDEATSDNEVSGHDAILEFWEINMHLFCVGPCWISLVRDIMEFLIIPHMHINLTF